MKLIQLTGNDAYSIQDANLVVGSSLIYDAPFANCFNLNEFDPATEYLSEEIAKRLHRTSGPPSEVEFAFTNQPKPVVAVNGTTVPFNLIHPYNYFHFLIEALPSLQNLITSNLLTDQHIIVSGILHPNMLHALKLVTNNRFQIMELHLHTAVHASQVIVAKDSYSANELISGKMVESFHFNQSNLLVLRRFFEKFIQPVQPYRKIFILRHSGQRNIVNIKQLASIAEVNGYEVIDPEPLSFKQQIDLFSSASNIVGPTGAWLANLLFVRQGIQVKVLYPSTCKTEISLWMRLADIFGVGVTDYYFDDIVLNRYQPIHSDFTVDLAAFERILND